VRRPHLAQALRVGAVVTLIIGVVYAGLAIALSSYVSRRVVWEVDQRLGDRLDEVSRLPGPLTPQPLPAFEGTDGAPVLLWWRPAKGAPRAITVGAPTLPDAAAGVTSTAISAPLVPVPGSPTYRFDALALDGGWLIAGQDLAGPSHASKVLVIGELIMGGALLVVVFASVVIISLRAVAPVERARRRQLELAADASHELRTPVTVIGAEVELARSHPGNADELLETLNHVARENARLERIIEDLLWLARFDANPPSPANRPTDLSATVRECSDRFDTVARSRGITLTVDDVDMSGSANGVDERAGESRGPWVEAPTGWLDRLCGTLLDNACRYAHEGGTVKISAGRRGARAVLTVEDDGPGIPDEERAHLFDRFHRAIDTPGGAGLGLAIADAVVGVTNGRWRIDRSALGGALMEVSWRPCDAPRDVMAPDVAVGERVSP
jgi:signal transduction histidine kinase